MKKGKKMLLMLCALAVLVAGYFGVQQLNQKNSVSETEGTYDLTVKQAEDLTGLSWTSDGTNWNFTLQDGVWTAADSSSWPVSQDTLQGMADELLSLQATRKIENVTSPADYGLETPVITVTARWEDGSETAYSMGDATPFADGYYLSVSTQSDVVYTIVSSLATGFSKTRTELAALEEIPTVSDITDFTVGTTLHAVKKESSTTVDPDQLWYSGDTGEPLDVIGTEALTETIGSLSWDELLSVSASDEDLTSWQLDDETAVTVSWTGSDGTGASVLFGTLNESSDYYARLPESRMVYSVDGETVSSLLTATADSLWVSSLLPLPYESLSSAEFATEKVVWRMKKAADDAEAAETETGTEADTESETGSSAASEEEADPAESARQEIWSKVTALKASEKLESAGEGGIILSIHAVSSSGTETTVVFSEHSADSYQAVVDGGAAMLVAADGIDALIRAVRAMQ